MWEKRWINERLPVFWRWARSAGGTVFAARQRLFAQVMDLPPASNAVSVNRAVPIMMADGVVLVGDHFAEN